MRTIFKNQGFKSLQVLLLATIIICILQHLETTKIIQMDFILEIGVSTFWADTDSFVAYRLGLMVPGLYTYRSGKTLCFEISLDYITALNI
jgi:hypothetical protein